MSFTVGNALPGQAAQLLHGAAHTPPKPSGIHRRMSTRHSTSVAAPDSVAMPDHVAIIMDGNGRWATRRGLPRAFGHRRGVEALRESIRTLGDRRVPYVTLFAFSSENWARPAEEVGELMGLLRRFIRRDLAELHSNDVRVRVIGRRDGLPPDILALLTEAERLTAGNAGMTLCVAFNYGARDEIARATRAIALKVATGEIAADAVTEATVEAHLDTAGIPAPDLVIRTSGERRLSNFLLWQAAYAEFVFVPECWPDFDRAALDAALAEYAGRKRRFGGLGDAPVVARERVAS